MFKNKLQQYIQKNSLPLPVYGTSNDGNDHLPRFKCSVTVNGAQYVSPPGFKHKKEAENAAAQAAIKDLDPQSGETGQLKQALNELATKKNIRPPTYQFTKEGEAHCPSFTATVEINGVFYTGAPGKNKKEAAGNAAYEAIPSIRTQDSNSFPQPELQDDNKRNNDFKQPTEECKVIESSSKMPADNFTSDNQLLAGKDSHSAKNSTEKLNVENAPALERVPVKINVEDPCAEKLNVENAPALERVPVKLNVEDPCAVGEDFEKSTVKDSGEVENGMPNINVANAGSAPIERPKQDPILVEQHRLQEETRDLYQDKDHGSTELEGNHESNQEVVLTESIGKRSRSENDNAEQMSQRKKKLKRKNRGKKKKIDGTA